MNEIPITENRDFPTLLSHHSPLLELAINQAMNDVAGVYESTNLQIKLSYQALEKLKGIKKFGHVFAPFDIVLDWYRLHMAGNGEIPGFKTLDVETACEALESFRPIEHKDPSSVLVENTVPLVIRGLFEHEEGNEPIFMSTLVTRRIDSSSDTNYPVFFARRSALDKVRLFVYRMNQAAKQRRIDARIITGIGGPDIPLERVTWDRLYPTAALQKTKKAVVGYLNNRQIYAARLRDRYGVLLWGPPGTGKSKTAAALITELGLPSYTIDVTNHRDMNDSTFMDAYNRIAREAPAIVLLEDLDRAYDVGENPRQEGLSSVSLRALLNALDGVGKHAGVITIATANQPGKLDPALFLRKGRFNKVIFFGPPCSAEAKEYLEQQLKDEAVDHFDIRDIMVAISKAYGDLPKDPVASWSAAGGCKVTMDILSNIITTAIMLCVEEDAVENADKDAPRKKITAAHMIEAVRLEALEVLDVTEGGLGKSQKTGFNKHTGF